ncbi:helix-turn-helix domain-containing protein [Microbacterium terrisoli]|jgi:excisionase family DNA binding protein|uniref:helix-turn-helix domain-containing protein n=1 Tax=Microbacterium terrisoli TaxID=3242192 RepID=UPI00280565B0|nr:helix-turn-helix domain-containing protein [Microbacterium protaetiae]
MPETSVPDARLVAPSEVAEALGITVDEVIALAIDGRLRGVRVGRPPQWRIAEDSVIAYLDEQTEETRRMALWRQSNAASFPELWGTGTVRRPD